MPRISASLKSRTHRRTAKSRDQRRARHAAGARRFAQRRGVVDSGGRWAAGNALLIVVGDSIDKGPQSLEVLDEWIALSAQAAAAGGRVVHTLGNHEAEFLAAPDDSRKAAELYAELQAKGVPVSDLTDRTKPYGKFLGEMPLAARVGRWLFCHAGLYPGPNWADFSSAAGAALSAGSYGDPLLSSDDSILEAKDWWKDPAARSALEARLEADGMYGLVQGHQPKAYGFRTASARWMGASYQDR